MLNFYFIVSVIVFILTFNFANSVKYSAKQYAKLRNEAAKCTRKSDTYKDAIGCNKCSCIGKKMLQCTVKLCNGVPPSDVVIPNQEDDYYDDETLKSSIKNSGAQQLAVKKKGAAKKKYNKLANSAQNCKPGTLYPWEDMCANCKCIYQGVIRCKRIPNCVKKERGFGVIEPEFED